jgi:hypothetical protein
MPRAKKKPTTKKPTKKTTERRKSNVGKKPDRRKENDVFWTKVINGWKKIFSPAK